MLLFALSLMLSYPLITTRLENPPPREEVLAYLESNPIPLEMTQNMLATHEFHINTAAFIQDADAALVMQLIEEGDVQQRALGLAAAMVRQMPNHVQHMLAAIDDESPLLVAKPMDSKLKTLSDLVWHWFNMSLQYHENKWNYCMAEITAAAKMDIFEAYLGRGQPRHRDRLLMRYTAPRRFEAHIRELAESGNTAALPALARFQNPTDIAWLALSLEPDQPDHPAWLAASLLPDPTFLPHIRQALQNILAEDGARRNTTYLFDALVAQDAAVTQDLIADFLDGIDLAHPAHTKHLFDFFRCATHDTNYIAKQEDLLLHAIRQFHIINEATFQHFAGKSKALKKQLLESLWRNPLTIYTEPDFPSAMKKNEFSRIDDPEYLAYLGVDPDHPKVNHPHVQESWY